MDLNRTWRAGLFALLLSGAAPAPAASPRLTIVISDTHFGVGKDSGRWHSFEDARWATEFSRFLQEMSGRGKGAADLVLNGDTFELWQSLRPDCSHPDKNLGCSEAEALQRLQRVLAGHRPELAALRVFANAGDNRVVVVPGNHDAALLFGRLAAEVVRAVGARQGRVRIAPEGYWISSDRLIYAEHGHQIGEEVNRFDRWPQPFRPGSPDPARVHLQRPWGEQFVQDYYNQFEQKYPIIDNFSDETLGVKYGFAAEGTIHAVRDIGRFGRFLLTRLSWLQIQQSLGEPGEAPQWDFPAIRAAGDRFLLESFPVDDPLRAPTQKALAEGVLGVSVSQLSDDEISSICSFRAALHEQQRQAGREPSVSTCPRRDLGAFAQRLFTNRNAVFAAHLDQTVATLTGAGLAERPFQLFVYSHTHLEDAGFSPLQGSGRLWNPYVVNTGAWQRTVKPAQMEAIVRSRGLTQNEVLRRLQPEDLPPCYPVVLVAPYLERPKASLQFWRQAGGRWELAASCE